MLQLDKNVNNNNGLQNQAPPPIKADPAAIQQSSFAKLVQTEKNATKNSPNSNTANNAEPAVPSEKAKLQKQVLSKLYALKNMPPIVIAKRISMMNVSSAFKKKYFPVLERFFKINLLTGYGQHGMTPIANKGKTIFEKINPFYQIVQVAAKQYRLPPELIAGVIMQESAGKPNAQSHCGAMGLMQLMPQTAAGLGVTNAWDPIQNIFGGAKYLRQMLNKFGRIDYAVAAYNAGPGAVQKHGGIPPFKETQGYVPRVLEFTRQFSQAGTFASMQKFSFKA